MSELNQQFHCNFVLEILLDFGGFKPFALLLSFNGYYILFDIDLIFSKNFSFLFQICRSQNSQICARAHSYKTLFTSYTALFVKKCQTNVNFITKKDRNVNTGKQMKEVGCLQF